MGRPTEHPEPPDAAARQQAARERFDTVRSATLIPTTWDDETNSCEVIFSTGARVIRYDWRAGKRFVEDLPLDGLDLSELNAGAHVLRQHGMDFFTPALDNVLGSVMPGTARVEKDTGGKLQAIARVQFSREECDRPIVNKIKSGVIRKWSYGYRRVGEPTLSNDPETGYEMRTWARHVANEISAVDVPADAFTDTRSQHIEEDPMGASAAAQTEDQTRQAPKPTPETPPAAPAAASDDALRAARLEGARAEAARQDGIRAAATKLGIDENDETVRALLKDSGKSLDVARDELIDRRAALAEKQPGIHSPQRAQMVRDEADTRRQGLIDGLAFRANAVGELPATGRPYVHMRMRDIARDCLRRAGARDVDLMSDDEAFDGALGFGGRAQSTSDFPQILAATANKNFLAGYSQEVENYLPLCQVRMVSDFKPQKELRMSGSPSLDELPEGAEIKFGTLAEGSETWSILSYGKGWRATRKMLINDDMSVFGTVPARQGAAVTRTKLNLFWALITGNVALGDTKALFHADHANVTSSGGDVPGTAQIGKGRKLLRVQTDLPKPGETKGDTLGLIPDFIVIPAELETTVDQLLTGITPAESGKVVPKAIQSLTPIVEARLDAHSLYFWYLMTKAAQWANFVYGQLAGSPAPRFRARESWAVQGLEMLVEYDCGFAAIDHRGVYRNKGQA